MLSAATFTSAVSRARSIMQECATQLVFTGMQTGEDNKVPGAPFFAICSTDAFISIMIHIAH
jgi:hypothetical protein